MGARKHRPQTTESEQATLQLVPTCGYATLGRIPEIDAIRGIAAILMIVFHLSYDLKTFSSTPPELILNLPRQYWAYAPELIGTLFFLCLGASLKVAYDSTAPKQRRRLILWRAFRLALIAAGITAATAVFIPKLTIIFGVIHCMAACTLLLLPHLSKPRLSAFLGTFYASLGIWLTWQTFGFRSLYWLGFRPINPVINGDYYPVLPWLGVALGGVFAAELLQNRGLGWEPRYVIWRPILFLGRNSLLVYLVHQPILLTLIYTAEFLSRRS